MHLKLRVNLQYGIMFLYDPYDDYRIPEDTGASSITFTESCICFQVASYVDGEALVTISDLPFEEGFSYEEPFKKRITAKAKYISLADTATNYYCMLRLKDKFADLAIWSYQRDGQEMSWVQIGNLDLF